MTPLPQISEALTSHTCVVSNYDTRREYVSMSKASMSVDQLVADFINGTPGSVETMLKCYKGYQMEADLKRRIETVFASRVYMGHIEYSAFDGLVKGHPDFLFDEFPADCKSVLKDGWLPSLDSHLSNRIYWQMQAYMYYARKDKALVVFESRESGKIVDRWIDKNSWIQALINAKFEEVADIITKKSAV